MNVKPFVTALLTLIAGTAGAFGQFKISWPTDATIYQDGKLYDAYLQPTDSGDRTSALFGCVRDHDRRFHEGIDIKPTERDWMQEPTDQVRSILPGKVVYINRVVSHSHYGRYIVIEHDQPEKGFYSLYAHLRSIPDAIAVGDDVLENEPIGVMGRSTDDNSISKAKARLHFEFGVRLGDDFQSWYDAQKFDRKNYHGLWNDKNLLGIDLLDFIKQTDSGKVDSFHDYLVHQQLAVSVKVQSRKMPDFVLRYPFVLAEPANAGEVYGWQINFNWYGFPMAWRPLTAKEVAPMGPNNVQIVFQDTAVLNAHPCNDMVASTWNGVAAPGKRLKRILGILFGF